MARHRTIKPIHWSDKELANISLQAHLLWIATWNFSDDEGIFEGDCHLIRSQVFPRRTDIRIEQVEQWLDQLVKARFVIPFTYNGGGYYISRTFKTHQKIDKPQKSKIPKEFIENVLCNSNNGSIVFDEHSSNGSGSVAPRVESRGEEKRVEESRPAPNEDQCYDIEKYILAHPIDFEAICMSSPQKNPEKVKEVLEKFHLWNIRNEKYPDKPLKLIAGLKTWLLNEKNYSNGRASNNSRTFEEKPTPTGNVASGGFGKL